MSLRAVGDRQRAVVVVAVFACALFGFLPVGARTLDGLHIPSGYRARVSHLAKGVDLFTLTRSGHQVINVARLSPGASARLVAVVAHNRVGGSSPELERTSSMCRRIHCLAAINADYFSFTTGAFAGGAIVNGEPFKSSEQRPHLVIGPSGAPGLTTPLDLGMRLTVHYPTRLLGITLHDDPKTYDLGQLNVPRRGAGVFVYTPRFGARTGTRGGAELILSRARLRTGSTVPAHIAAYSTRGNSKIPSGGAVLSATGDGAKTLRQIWSDVRAGRADADTELTVASTATQALGGKPVLMRNGKIGTKGTSVAPRTAVGWAADGTVYLFAADGRRSGYASGLTTVQVAKMLRGFGARDALGFDDGGSTTFVVRGHVMNRPSDGHERAVKDALAIVAA